MFIAVWVLICILGVTMCLLRVHFAIPCINSFRIELAGIV
jgi:hypothetical protein